LAQRIFRLGRGRKNVELYEISRRFGTIAVEKGYITIDQLTRALNIQLLENMNEGRHRLIGAILLEQNFIDVPQVNEVLRTMGVDSVPHRMDA
jgi:hypothetical protein